MYEYKENEMRNEPDKIDINDFCGIISTDI